MHRRIQAGAKSVAAPLVCTNARNIEVLTDFQPVNAGTPDQLRVIGIELPLQWSKPKRRFRNNVTKTSAKILGKLSIVAERKKQCCRGLEYWAKRPTCGKG
jgi:hypothetical protein